MGALYLCSNCDFYQKARPPHFRCERCLVEGMIYREAEAGERKDAAAPEHEE
jgi:rubredoxin